MTACHHYTVLSLLLLLLSGHRGCSVMGKDAPELQMQNMGQVTREKTILDKGSRERIGNGEAVDGPEEISLRKIKNVPEKMNKSFANEGAIPEAVKVNLENLANEKINDKAEESEFEYSRKFPEKYNFDQILIRKEGNVTNEIDSEKYEVRLQEEVTVKNKETKLKKEENVTEENNYTAMNFSADNGNEIRDGKSVIINFPYNPDAKNKPLKVDNKPKIDPPRGEFNANIITEEEKYVIGREIVDALKLISLLKSSNKTYQRAALKNLLLRAGLTPNITADPSDQKRIDKYALSAAEKTEIQKTLDEKVATSEDFSALDYTSEPVPTPAMQVADKTDDIDPLRVLAYGEDSLPKDINDKTHHTYKLISEYPFVYDNNGILNMYTGKENLREKIYFYVLDHFMGSNDEIAEIIKTLWFDPNYVDNHQWDTFHQENNGSIKGSPNIESDYKFDWVDGKVNPKGNRRTHSPLFVDQPGGVVTKTQSRFVTPITFDTGRYTSNFKVINENQRNGDSTFQEIRETDKPPTAYHEILTGQLTGEHVPNFVGKMIEDDSALVRDPYHKSSENFRGQNAERRHDISSDSLDFVSDKFKYPDPTTRSTITRTGSYGNLQLHQYRKNVIAAMEQNKADETSSRQKVTRGSTDHWREYFSQRKKDRVVENLGGTRRQVVEAAQNADNAPGNIEMPLLTKILVQKDEHLARQKGYLEIQKKQREKTVKGDQEKIFHSSGKNTIIQEGNDSESSSLVKKEHKSQLNGGTNWTNFRSNLTRRASQYGAVSKPDVNRLHTVIGRRRSNMGHPQYIRRRRPPSVKAPIPSRAMVGPIVAFKNPPNNGRRRAHGKPYRFNNSKRRSESSPNRRSGGIFGASSDNDVSPVFAGAAMALGFAALMFSSTSGISVPNFGGPQSKISSDSIFKNIARPQSKVNSKNDGDQVTTTKPVIQSRTNVKQTSSARVPSNIPQPKAWIGYVPSNFKVSNFTLANPQNATDLTSGGVTHNGKVNVKNMIEQNVTERPINVPIPNIFIQTKAESNNKIPYNPSNDLGLRNINEYIQKNMESGPSKEANIVYTKRTNSAGIRKSNIENIVTPTPALIITGMETAGTPENGEGRIITPTTLYTGRGILNTISARLNAGNGNMHLVTTSTLIKDTISGKQYAAKNFPGFLPSLVASLQMSHTDSLRLYSSSVDTVSSLTYYFLQPSSTASDISTNISPDNLKINDITTTVYHVPNPEALRIPSSQPGILPVQQVGSGMPNNFSNQIAQALNSFSVQSSLQSQNNLQPQNSFSHLQSGLAEVISNFFGVTPSLPLNLNTGLQTDALTNVGITSIGEILPTTQNTASSNAEISTIGITSNAIASNLNTGSQNILTNVGITSIGELSPTTQNTVSSNAEISIIGFTSNTLTSNVGLTTEISPTEITTNTGAFSSTASVTGPGSTPQAGNLANIAQLLPQNFKGQILQFSSIDELKNVLNGLGEDVTSSSGNRLVEILKALTNLRPTEQGNQNAQLATLNELPQVQSSSQTPINIRNSVQQSQLINDASVVSNTNGQETKTHSQITAIDNTDNVEKEKNVLEQLKTILRRNNTMLNSETAPSAEPTTENPVIFRRNNSILIPLSERIKQQPTILIEKTEPNRKLVTNDNNNFQRLKNQHRITASSIANSQKHHFNRHNDDIQNQYHGYLSRNITKQSHISSQNSHRDSPISTERRKPQYSQSLAERYQSWKSTNPVSGKFIEGDTYYGNIRDNDESNKNPVSIFQDRVGTKEHLETVTVNYSENYGNTAIPLNNNEGSKGSKATVSSVQEVAHETSEAHFAPQLAFSGHDENIANTDLENQRIRPISYKEIIETPALFPYELSTTSEYPKTVSFETITDETNSYYIHEKATDALKITSNGNFAVTSKTPHKNSGKYIIRSGTVEFVPDNDTGIALEDMITHATLAYGKVTNSYNDNTTQGTLTTVSPIDSTKSESQISVIDARRKATGTPIPHIDFKTNGALTLVSTSNKNTTEFQVSLDDEKASETPTTVHYGSEGTVTTVQMFHGAVAHRPESPVRFSYSSKIINSLPVTFSDDHGYDTEELDFDYSLKTTNAKKTISGTTDHESITVPPTTLSNIYKTISKQKTHVNDSRKIKTMSSNHVPEIFESNSNKPNDASDNYKRTNEPQKIEAITNDSILESLESVSETPEPVSLSTWIPLMVPRREKRRILSYPATAKKFLNKKALNLLYHGEDCSGGVCEPKSHSVAKRNADKYTSWWTWFVINDKKGSQEDFNTDINRDNTRTNNSTYKKKVNINPNNLNYETYGMEGENKILVPHDLNTGVNEHDNNAGDVNKREKVAPNYGDGGLSRASHEPTRPALAHVAPQPNYSLSAAPTPASQFEIDRRKWSITTNKIMPKQRKQSSSTNNIDGNQRNEYISSSDIEKDEVSKDEIPPIQTGNDDEESRAFFPHTNSDSTRLNVFLPLTEIDTARPNATFSSIKMGTTRSKASSRPTATSVIELEMSEQDWRSRYVNGDYVPLSPRENIVTPPAGSTLRNNNTAQRRGRKLSGFDFEKDRSLKPALNMKTSKSTSKLPARQGAKMSWRKVRDEDDKTEEMQQLFSDSTGKEVLELMRKPGKNFKLRNLGTNIAASENRINILNQHDSKSRNERLLANKQNELKEIIQEFRLGAFIRDFYKHKKKLQLYEHEEFAGKLNLSSPESEGNSREQKKTLKYSSPTPQQNTSNSFSSKVFSESAAAEEKEESFKNSPMIGNVRAGSMPHKMLLFLLEQYKEKLEQIKNLHGGVVHQKYGQDDGLRFSGDIETIDVASRLNLNLESEHPKTIEQLVEEKINDSQGIELRPHFEEVSNSPEKEKAIIDRQFSEVKNYNHEYQILNEVDEEKRQKQRLLDMLEEFWLQEIENENSQQNEKQNNPAQNIRKKPTLRNEATNTKLDSSQHKIQRQNYKTSEDYINNNENIVEDTDRTFLTRDKKNDFIKEQYRYDEANKLKDDLLLDPKITADIQHLLDILSYSDFESKYDGNFRVEVSDSSDLEGMNNHSVYDYYDFSVEPQSPEENLKLEKHRLSQVESFTPLELERIALEEFISDLSESLNKHDERWSLSHNLPRIEVSIPEIGGKNWRQAPGVQSSDGMQLRKTGNSEDFIVNNVGQSRSKAVQPQQHHHSKTKKDHSKAVKVEPSALDRIAANSIKSLGMENAVVAVKEWANAPALRNLKSRPHGSADQHTEIFSSVQGDYQSIDSQSSFNRKMDMAAAYDPALTYGQSKQDKLYDQSPKSKMPVSEVRTKTDAIRYQKDRTGFEPEVTFEYDSQKVYHPNHDNSTSNRREVLKGNADHTSIPEGFSVSSLLSILNPNKPDILNNLNTVIDLIIGGSETKTETTTAALPEVTQEFAIKYPLATVYDFPKSRSSLEDGSKGRKGNGKSTQALKLEQENEIRLNKFPSTQKSNSYKEGTNDDSMIEIFESEEEVTGNIANIDSINSNRAVSKLSELNNYGVNGPVTTEETSFEGSVAGIKHLLSSQILEETGQTTSMIGRNNASESANESLELAGQVMMNPVTSNDTVIANSVVKETSAELQVSAGAGIPLDDHDYSADDHDYSADDHDYSADDNDYPVDENDYGVENVGFSSSSENKVVDVKNETDNLIVEDNYSAGENYYPEYGNEFIDNTLENFIHSSDEDNSYDLYDSINVAVERESEKIRNNITNADLNSNSNNLGFITEGNILKNSQDPYFYHHDSMPLDLSVGRKAVHKNISHQTHHDNHHSHNARNQIRPIMHKNHHAHNVPENIKLETPETDHLVLRTKHQNDNSTLPVHREIKQVYPFQDAQYLALPGKPTIQEQRRVLFNKEGKMVAPTSGNVMVPPPYRNGILAPTEQNNSRDIDLYMKPPRPLFNSGFDNRDYSMKPSELVAAHRLKQPMLLDAFDYSRRRGNKSSTHATRNKFFKGEGLQYNRFSQWTAMHNPSVSTPPKIMNRKIYIDAANVSDASSFSSKSQSSLTKKFSANVTFHDKSDFTIQRESLNPALHLQNLHTISEPEANNLSQSNKQINFHPSYRELPLLSEAKELIDRETVDTKGKEINDEFSLVKDQSMHNSRNISKEKIKSAEHILVDVGFKYPVYSEESPNLRDFDETQLISNISSSIPVLVVQEDGILRTVSEKHLSKHYDQHNSIISKDDKLRELGVEQEISSEEFQPNLSEEHNVNTLESAVDQLPFADTVKTKILSDVSHDANTSFDRDLYSYIVNNFLEGPSSNTSQEEWTRTYLVELTDGEMTAGGRSSLSCDAALCLSSALLLAALRLLF